MNNAFPIGSVGHNLTLMCGIWHDHVEIYDPAGSPLSEDAHSGTPGAAPFDNLVYVSFDGLNYRQTNVTFQGRPIHTRSFTGKLVQGVLHFDPLGPQDPGHIGVSGGYGILFFVPASVTVAWQRYSEPDCIRLLSLNQRTRTTVLYREGKVVRTLTANGYKIAPMADQRAAFDPRGRDGPVHEPLSETHVFAQSKGI